MTIIKEDNKALAKKGYKPPKEVVKKLMTSIATYGHDETQPNFKRAKYLLDKGTENNDNKKYTYNDRSKGKQTQGVDGVPQKEMERLKNFFKYTPQDPKNIAYSILGGETTQHWVNSALDAARNSVKPVEPVRDNNIAKPSKPSSPKTSVKCGNLNINVENKNKINNKSIFITEEQVDKLALLLNNIK